MSFSDSSQNASNWFWDFGNGNTSTQQSPLDSFPVSGSYLIRLVVTDGLCSDTATQTLVVVDSLGMNKMALPFHVLVFPNPVSYQAKIDVVKMHPSTGRENSP
ncbi:MAG: PKD domain-containing protein [Bacteroidia bacterium]